MLHLIQLQRLPIERQLCLEKELLRHDERNWCVLNWGAPPAIVLGISGKEEQWLERPHDTAIPLVRRFSGGGTVFIDERTLFVTFICNESFLQIPSRTDKIMAWTEEFYRDALDLEGFRLLENDYVLGNKKFGGNAQYLTKTRWLHHSSLLWDFDSTAMNLLKLPPRMPSYRRGRAHGDFLCALKDYFPSPEALRVAICRQLYRRFEVKEIEFESLSLLCRADRNSGTKQIVLNE